MPSSDKSLIFIFKISDCRNPDSSQGKVLNLQEAIEQHAVIYFCLQPLAFPAYAEGLGKLIINDIKACAASRLQTKDKLKIFTIFDEFSVFAGDQVINLINQGRSEEFMQSYRRNLFLIFQEMVEMHC
jgi:hypothetical protein